MARSPAGSAREDERTRASFRLGFVDRLETTAPAFEAARAHPSLRFVRELRLDMGLAQLPPLPTTLEALEISTRGDRTFSATALTQGLVRLRRLEVRANGFELDVDLPELRALTLHVEQLTADRWRERLPALEALHLRSSLPPAELLEKPPPRLRTLRVAWTDQVKHLLGTSLLRQLSVLDLSEAHLEGVAEALRDHARALAHLELLDLRRSKPTEELQALRELGSYVKGPRQRR